MAAAGPRHAGSAGATGTAAAFAVRSFRLTFRCYRSRSDRFEDLVLLAVSQLEPRWEAELSGMAFSVEEIPPVIPDNDDPEPVPLARLEQAPDTQGGPAMPDQAGFDGQPELPAARPSRPGSCSTEGR